MVKVGPVGSDIHLGYRLGCSVIGILSRLARSRERWSFGVDDTEVLGSTSIALSEALEDREPSPETCVSGFDVRLSRGTCATEVGRPVFDVDGGAALTATTEGAGGAATGPQTAIPVGS